MGDAAPVRTFAPRGLALRPITDADLPFLAEVYASTRREELAPVPWTAEQKAAFLQMQFAAQHSHYREHYAKAAFDLVLVDGVAAGRLYVASLPEELRIVDIAILPAYRNRQIGTRLITTIQAEAAAARKPLRIHVERMNRALGLYHRLGFRIVEDKGIYLLLEWRPDTASEHADV